VENEPLTYSLRARLRSFANFNSRVFRNYVEH